MPFRSANDVSLVRHPLSEVCPAFTASTTMRDGLNDDRSVVDHDVVSRVRVGDRAWHERRELVLGRPR